MNAKRLQKITGARLADCTRALELSDGDLDRAAAVLLRGPGDLLSLAVKNKRLEKRVKVLEERLDALTSVSLEAL